MTKYSKIAKLEIFTEDQPWKNTVSLWITASDSDGRRYICKPMVMEFTPMEEGQATTPSFEFHGSIAREFFPALHDALIRSGYLKPKKDESIEAIKYHLEDMRKLVFEGKK